MVLSKRSLSSILRQKFAISRKEVKIIFTFSIMSSPIEKSQSVLAPKEQAPSPAIGNEPVDSA